MSRGFLTLIAVAVALGGCGLRADKQWYKPGVDYTVADFQRDRAACEKNGTLDEDCLRQRGWAPLSTDKEPPPPPQNVGPRGTSGRY